MKNKWKKILILATIIFFSSITPTYAREMSFSELGNELKMAKWGDDRDSAAEYAYLIGSYVFTSNHILRTQDMMLAARSVDPSDPGKLNTDSIYQKMSIILLDYNTTTNKWEHKAIIGKDTIDEDNLTINYIDYVPIKNLTEAKVGIDLNNSENITKYQEIIETTYGFTGGNDTNSIDLDYHDNQLSGTLKKFKGELTPNTFGQEDLTSYYFVFFADFQEKDKLTNQSTIKIITKGETGNVINEKVFTKGKNFDSDNGIVVLFAYHPNSNCKTIEIVLDLDGENDQYDEAKYIMDISNLNYQKESLGSTFKLATEQEIGDEGFKWQAASALHLDESIITGTLKSQKYEEEGYYIPLKIIVPDTIKESLKNWSLTLNDHQVINFTSSDYKNGYVIVIVKVTEGKGQIKYTIDFDGEQDDYIAHDEVIKTNIELEAKKEITFVYLDQDGQKQNSKVYVNSDEIISESMIPSNVAPKYHTLTGWFKEENKFVFDSVTTNENITLTAHYTIDGDNFIDDIIENLKIFYTDKFNDITRNANVITFNIKNYTVKLKDLTPPKLPGIINYVLDKQEILDITFDIALQSAKFNDSDDQDSIKEKLETLFTNVLSEKYEQFTLSNMALYDKTFTITLGEMDSIVELLNNNHVYTIKFVANDEATVNNEEDLIKALENTKITKINVASSFQVTKPHDLSHNLKIVSLDNTYTLQASTNIDTIFKVSGASVDISDLKMTGAKQAIVIEENATLKATNLDLSNNTDTGILVKAGGNLVASELKYSNEKYDHPVVKAATNEENKKARVDLTVADNKKASSNVVYEINTYEQQGSPTDFTIYVGDEKRVKPNYNYTHYFLDNNIADRWVKISYVGDRTLTSYPVSFTRYYDKESQLDYAIEPPKNLNYLTSYEDKLATYSIANWTYWTAEGQVTKASGQVPIPTTDMVYYAQLKSEYKDNVIKIKANVEGAEEQLINAVKTDSAFNVVIIEGSINLTKGMLDIAKENILITGSDSGKVNVAGEIIGQIKITADNVKFEKLKITGNTSSPDSRNDVVTVNGHKLYLSSVNFNANAIDGGTMWDSLVHYSYATPTSTIYFSNFDGTNAKSLVEFSGTITDQTRLIGNHYIGGENTKDFIIINEGIAEGPDSILEIKQATSNLASCTTECYGVKIKASNKSTNVNVDLGGSWFEYTDQTSILKILIEITDDVYDVSEYTFKVSSKFKDRVKIYYQLNGKITEYNPKNASSDSYEYDAKIQ